MVGARALRRTRSIAAGSVQSLKKASLRKAPGLRTSRRLAGAEARSAAATPRAGRSARHQSKTGKKHKTTHHTKKKRGHGDVELKPAIWDTARTRTHGPET